MNLSSPKFIFSLLSVILWSLTAIHLSQGLQILSGLIYLIFLSFLYGLWFFPEHQTIWQIITGLFVVMTTLIITGALLIYTYQLNSIIISLIFAGLNILPLFFSQQLKITLPKLKKPQLTITNIALLLFTVISTVILYNYFLASTTDNIFSPWLLLPPYILLLFAINVLIALFYCHQNKNSNFIIVSSIIFFISTSLALFIYRLGYGFDPFIHDATIDIIQKTGTITPKPLYYLGFYSLIINLKWLTGLTISLLNKWLIPVLLSTILPGFIYYIFHLHFNEKQKSFHYLPLIFLILPFSLFINSTPQALANLLFIFLLLWQFITNHQTKYHFIISSLLTLAILVIHPLTGMPALFLWLFTIFKNYSLKKNIKTIIHRTVMIEVSILGAFAIPTLFILNSYLNNNPVKLALAWPVLTTNIFQTFFKYFHFVSFFDVAYLLPLLIKLIFLGGVLGGVVYLLKEDKLSNYSHFLYLYLIVLVNLWICKYWLTYHFLISYEQEAYATRILDLSWLILLPFALIGFALIIRKIIDHSLLHRLFAALLLTALITTSFYLSYPRRDPYHFNKSINTSSYDYQAVAQINQVAPADYLVLANQAVSAAAIDLYGFAKYYDDLFYYPLPTSSPLYQSYLDLAYQKKPINSVLNKIVAQTSQSDIYFVINDYWDGFANIVDEHKKNATSWQIIGPDKIYIFYYNLNNLVSRI